MANVLITGGAGFIGSHLAERCAQLGDTVHIAVRPETSLHRLEFLEKSLTIHRIELWNQKTLDRCFAKAMPELVYHLAAKTRRRNQSELADVIDSINEDLINLIALVRSASAADPPPRIFIRSGSLAEYGIGPAPAREDQRERPLTAYSAALVAGTQYAQMLQHRLPFPLVTARLALVYGPRQSQDFFIPGLISHCLAGKPTKVRRGRDRRDLLYIDDATNALVHLAACRRLGGQIVNIATGIAPTMHEIADLIITLTGADPGLVEFGQVDDPEAIPDFRASPALAKDAMGWQADISFPEGIERTVAWFRQQKSV